MDKTSKRHRATRNLTSEKMHIHSHEIEGFRSSTMKRSITLVSVLMVSAMVMDSTFAADGHSGGDW